VLNCPKSGALENKQGKRSLRPVTVIAVVIVLFFGSVFGFQLAGVYKVLPDQIKTGERISFDEIKGYMTIKEAADATETELKEFYSKFGIPDNVPSETMMKDISKIAPDYDLDKAKERIENPVSETEQELPAAETKINAEGVKGSMTIKDASVATGVDLKEFYAIFKIPEDVPSNTYMKDIANKVDGYDFQVIKESLK
jgi:cell division protein FtsB